MGATAVSLAAATAGATAGATDAPAGTAEPLVLVKRQAPAAEPIGCILYRYGTFSTQLDIVRECRAGGPGRGGAWGGAEPTTTPRPVAEGIESVAIVQVVPVVPVGSESSVELTVTCEGR